MRKLLRLCLALASAAPTLAPAQDRPRVRIDDDHDRAPAMRSAPAPRHDLRAPAPPRGPAPRAVPPRPAPRVAYGPWDYALGVDALPFWLGWSWGWGYYPLYPTPAYPGAEPGYLPEEARRVTARLDLRGAGASNAAAGSIGVTMEGPIAGFSADVTGLALPDPSGRGIDSAALTLGGARATWAFLSEAAVRLRFEAGAGMTSVPSTGGYATARYANTLYLGPQVGLSGHLGLLGPFGIEGHARVTPIPLPVFDAGAALAVRGGPLAVTAGWRWIDVNGDGVDKPEGHFAGPELGLQLVF
jgi:hypothetical protein